MSLINAKHLVAPLKNKVHLISIFIIAALIAAFRMQGGDLIIQPKFEHPKLHQDAPQENLQRPRALRPRNAVNNTYNTRGSEQGRTQNNQRQLLDKILREKKAKQPDEKKAKDRNNSERLAEIEKSLGLR